MNYKTISNAILRAVVVLAAVALLLYFLWKIQSVLLYIVIAAVISLIGHPMVNFFQKKIKLPNTPAVILTMFLFVGILITLLSLFVPLILEQGKNLSLLDIRGLRDNIQHIIDVTNNYLKERGINILDTLDSSDWLSNFDIGIIPDILNLLVNALGNFGIGLFSVLFISFFFLKDNRILNNALVAFIPEKKEARFQKSLITIKKLLSRYFIGLLLQISILFVLYTLLLVILGVSNAVVIAFLCALLNLIPYVGPLVGAFFMLFLTMTGQLGQDFQTVILPTSLYVMAGYAVAQLIDNFVSQPLIFSSSVKSHPLEIFLVIIIGGTLFGVVGMIAAVPSYTAIKVILKEFFFQYKVVKSLTKSF